MKEYHRKKLKSRTLKEKIKELGSQISSLEERELDNKATIARLQGVIANQNTELGKCQQRIEVKIRF